jgi:hypothetical protein
VFDLEWTEESEKVFRALQQEAIEIKNKREKQKRSKSSK